MALSPVETGTIKPVSGGPALRAIRFEEIYEAAGNVGTTGAPAQPLPIAVPPSDSNDFSNSLIAAIL